MDGALEGRIGGGLFDLICKRVSKLPRSRLVVCATPTGRGTDIIEKLYECSDRPRYPSPFELLQQPAAEKA